MREMTRETTRPVGAVLSWEGYCAALGIDAAAARRATLTAALFALVGGTREARGVPRFEPHVCDGTEHRSGDGTSFSTEPSERSPED